MAKLRLILLLFDNLVWVEKTLVTIPAGFLMF
jgi:hypothetical protein